MLEIDSSKMGLDFLKDIPMPALCSVRIINVSKAEVGLEILLEFWRLRQTTGSFVYLIALPSGLGPKEFVTQHYKVSDFYHMFFVSDYGGQVGNRDTYPKLYRIPKLQVVLFVSDSASPPCCLPSLQRRPS